MKFTPSVGVALTTRFMSLGNVKFSEKPSSREPQTYAKHHHFLYVI
jgi:hypothetical protein